MRVRQSMNRSQAIITTAATATTTNAAIRVRVDIIGHARIKYVGKYQSCMV